MADLDFSPAQTNLTGIRSGDQVTFTAYFSTSGTLQNMTGTWTAYLRTLPPAVATIGSFTVGTTNAASGTVTFTLGTAITGTVLAAEQNQWQGYWDAQLNTGSGNVKTYLAGNVVIDRDITR